jgi:pyruvate dehydrogenase E1 component
MEVDGRGISSYPHPWLMPEFWQVPTVSMAWARSAIYQARNWKYLEGRGLMPASDRRWASWAMARRRARILGDFRGRPRRPDNLVFVINRNPQRLTGARQRQDHPGAGGQFRGAGWNVIKNIWGSAQISPARARPGKLRQLMMETVDGEYQNCKAFGGKYTRENFFNKYPETAQLVANLSDDDIWRFNRGGHDPHKVYAVPEAVATAGAHCIPGKDGKGYAWARRANRSTPPPDQEA